MKLDDGIRFDAPPNIHLEHRSQIRENVVVDVPNPYKISVVHTYVIGIVNMPVV